MGQTGGFAASSWLVRQVASYLRKLLVHGARAVLRHATNRDDGLNQWLNRLSTRKHVNVVIVALANKTARVAWAMMHNDNDYDPIRVAALQVIQEADRVKRKVS